MMSAPHVNVRAGAYLLALLWVLVAGAGCGDGRSVIRQPGTGRPPPAQNPVRDAAATEADARFEPEGGDASAALDAGSTFDADPGPDRDLVDSGQNLPDASPPFDGSAPDAGVLRRDSGLPSDAGVMVQSGVTFVAMSTVVRIATDGEVDFSA